MGRVLLRDIKVETMMTTIAEVMTPDVAVVSPQDSVQKAARMMAEWNVGALPVCEGKKLVGMLTDRDIAIRAVPTGKAPADITVSEVMSDDVRWCYEDQHIGEALQEMGDEQIRRLPVLSRNSMELIGIVSLGDIAARRAEVNVDPTLQQISTPSAPIRPAPH